MSILAALAQSACVRSSELPGVAVVRPEALSQAEAFARGGLDQVRVSALRSASSRGHRAKKRKAATHPAHTAAPLPVLADHQSALLRQLGAEWGMQRDRDNQANFPLVDPSNWRRVRFRGVPHFTAFTYGQNHNLVSSAFVVKTDARPSSRRCMALFESEAMREYESLGGRRTAIRERRIRWQDQEVLVHSGDGELSVLFSNYQFSVAWAAYPAYEDGCLVYATVVLWGDKPSLARQVRDRWAREGFQRYGALTSKAPSRISP